MTKTLRAKLDQIDDWLLGEDGKELADVLSAIRGPDDQQDHLKNEYTNPIRREAFPRTFAKALEVNRRRKESDFDSDTSSNKTGWWVLDSQPAPLPDMKFDNFLGHFQCHIKLALKALTQVKEENKA